MIRSYTRNAALLCLILAITLSGLVQNTANAAVLPRLAPVKVAPMQGDALTAPTPLPVVATYTLYFGNTGATTAPPMVSQTSVPSTSSVPASTASPSQSSSNPGKCSKKKHTSISTGILVSTSVSSKTSASSTTSASRQQNSVFPTVGPANPTASTSQRMSINAVEVLPHNFVNKVDALVDTYHGLTGRKARQVALILSNQTSVVANTSRTDTILSNLAEAYPSNNATTAQNVTMQTPKVVDWTTTNRSVPDAAAVVDVAGTSQFPQQYVVQAGRSNTVLFSNTAGYGPNEVRHDLHVIRAWAGDLDQLSTPALLDETVAAIMSASARYFPELATRDACRVIMADIKAESDFDPTNVSGGRLDSGSSWGLLQVSPFGSGELDLFRQHATVRHNTYSWDLQYNVSTTPATFGAGALLDWDTGRVLDVNSLSVQDLFRPWINIHIATWIQSNLARTSSQDPYTWQQIYTKTNLARNSRSSGSNGNDRVEAAWLAVTQALVGARLPRSFLTALGSWVAGPAVDGYGSYTQPGDDISKPYFSNIVQGLSVLFNSSVQSSWLNGLTLHAGLVDYH